MSDFRRLCDAVDGAAMMRQLATIAQWMKLSGTADEAISLRHIRSEFDSLGLGPARSDTARFLTVDATRARNRMLHIATSERRAGASSGSLNDPDTGGLL